MENVTVSNLTAYYEAVKQSANLKTIEETERWSRSVLTILGIHLSRGKKKKLAKALPDTLANQLTRGFWLKYFPDPNMSQHDFLKKIARRSGATDAQFARIPTKAVFKELKGLIDKDLSDEIADSLPTEVGNLWQEA